jgi:hypothetical protein
MKKEDLKSILSWAKNRPPDNPSSYVLMVRVMAVCLVALAVMAVLVSFLYKKTAAREAVLERTVADLMRQNTELVNTVGRLDGRVKHLIRTRLRADMLSIEGLSVRNVDGEVTVTGSVRNRGKRGVYDVELTVYCLDEAGGALCEERHVTSSSDGLPLKKGQRRRFRIRVEEVPSRAEEVLVLITDVDVGSE